MKPWNSGTKCKHQVLKQCFILNCPLLDMGITKNCGMLNHEQGTWHFSLVTLLVSCTNAVRHISTIIFCFRYFIPWVLHSLIFSFSSRNTLCIYITFHIFMYIYINTNKLMNQSLHSPITISFTIPFYCYITNVSEHYTLQIFNLFIDFYINSCK